MTRSRVFRASLLTLFSLVSFSSSAWAVRYTGPMYRGYHLDWCRIFENDCGKGAADAFCNVNGYGPATGWNFWANPGFKTMTVGQNSVCDPGSHRCDSFGYIDCQEKERTFNYPNWGRYRLDWCRIFENDCGAPAADSFCRRNGFARNGGFQLQANAGAETMTVDQNAVCNPAVHRCDSFTYIRCVN